MSKNENIVELQNDIEKEFDKYMNMVNNGKAMIEKYVEKNMQQITLILPENDENILNALLKKINKLEQNYQFIQFFTVYEIHNIENYTNLPYRVTIVNNKEMESILRYASMIGLNSLKIISLYKPSSQKAARLVGYKDIDIDKIVLRCLLGIMEGV